MEETLVDIQESLEKLLVGQEILSIEGATLKLKNGLTLTAYESEAECCAISYGEFNYLHDNFQAAITAIEVYKDFRDVDESYTGFLTVKILHNGYNIADFNGSADSGNMSYYFSVLALRVTDISGELVADLPLISSDIEDNFLDSWRKKYLYLE